MKTRAAINTVPGHPLTVEEVGVPDPKPDQVIVKLLSSGLCHSQLHQMHNRSGNPLRTGHHSRSRRQSCYCHLGAQNANPRATATDAIGCHRREEPVNGTVYTWEEDALVELTCSPGGHALYTPVLSGPLAMGVTTVGWRGAGRGIRD